MYLWSGTLSVFSAKVRIAAREKDLGLTIRDLAWTRASGWGDKPAELLAVSPRGEVPVLVDGELAVFDSTVINQYLEERCPDVPLMPGDPAGRARCRMWEELGDDVLSGVLPVLVREVFMKPGGQGRHDQAVAQAASAANAHFVRLEQALAGSDYLCGDFTVADVGNFLAVAFCRTLGAAPGEGHPHLAAWFERCYARPAVKAELDAITEAAAVA